MPRRTVRLVRRAVEVVHQFALVPHMVSRGDDVNPEIKKHLGNLRQQSWEDLPVGCVGGVRQAENDKEND